MADYTLDEEHFGLTYIATGEQTDGHYFQCSASIPPGDPGPPPHRHATESERFYVVSGRLSLVVEDAEHLLEAGDTFCVKPGETHTWSNKSTEVAELIITFSPSGIENMFRELDEPGAEFISVGDKYGMTTAD